MLRLVEVLLFLAPFVAFGAWAFLGSRVSAAVMWGVVGALVVMGGGIVWYGRERSLPPGTVYVPAHLQDGRIVEGHGAKP